MSIHTGVVPPAYPSYTRALRAHVDKEAGNCCIRSGRPEAAVAPIGTATQIDTASRCKLKYMHNNVTAAVEGRQVTRAIPG